MGRGKTSGATNRKANALPVTTAGAAPVRNQRSPISVSAQLTPESSASAFPSAGAGAVATGCATARKSSSMPKATQATTQPCPARKRSPSNQGLRTRT